MDILWLAVKITFRLFVSFLKATKWMFEKALPWARQRGEDFSKNVNLSRYPFPFGSLAFEMTALWFLLATAIGFMLSRGPQNNVPAALFLGLIVLPLFLGFGQGVRKPPVDDLQITRFDSSRRLSDAEGETAHAQLPTLDSIAQPAQLSAQVGAILPAEEFSLVGDMAGLPTLSSLAEGALPTLAQIDADLQPGQEESVMSELGSMSDVSFVQAPMSAKDRFTAEEWQALMEAPELVIYAVMRVGKRTGPLQLVQEVGAGALAIAHANESPYDLIREASQWRDFGAIEGERPEVLPNIALDHCRQIMATLHTRVVGDETQAFASWLLELARTIASAASEQGIGGPKISPEEEDFLTELGQVLGQV